MLCYAMRCAVSNFSVFRFSCKCVENTESKGDKIMVNFNDVATNSQSYNALYGSRLDNICENPPCAPLDFANGTRVERYSLQRVDGQKPYASKKVVILPKNSPLRRLNLDKFELTKEKVRMPGDKVAPGLKKMLKLFNKNGEVMFEGTESIRQFMKTIAHIIRKG